MPSGADSQQVQAKSASPKRVTPAPSSPAAEPRCDADMLLVQGTHCRTVVQECIEPHPMNGGRNSSTRCLEFEAPTKCDVDSRVELSFCIDIYEWPNKRGHRPRVLTPWTEARKLCESHGKRLCYEDEWLFACEGAAALPYTYGYRRDPTICVSDRMYLPPKGIGLRWPECHANRKCRAAFKKVDQREPAGSFERCRSPFGVSDMNGNVNEWVEIRDQTYPRRSGIKGGWWGPVRNQCRPTVKFHKEDDWGYEVGFRCCSTPQPSSVDAD